MNVQGKNFFHLFKFHDNRPPITAQSSNLKIAVAPKF